MEDPSVRGPRLRVVAINDVYTLDNLPRLATLLRTLTHDDPVDRTLVTLAGDFLAPSLLSSLDQGRGMVAVLNALGVTHVTFGNHEDDIAPTALAERMRELRAVWLASNVQAPVAWHDAAGRAVTLPEVDHVNIVAPSGQRVRVALIGVVVDDASVYRHAPFGGVTLLPAAETARHMIHALVDAGADLVLPLTHLPLDADVHLAEALSQSPEAAHVPLVLGGHDHSAGLTRVGTTTIAKAGHDASQAIIAELTWPVAADRPPALSIRLEPVTGYAPDPALAGLVDHTLTAVRALAEAVLYRIPAGQTLSSLDTRNRQTSLGTLIASCIRDGSGADVGVINGGGIRCATTYRDHFTFADLENELPFANEIVVVTMPGATLAAAIASSRARAPRDAGGYLQIDDGVSVDADGGPSFDEHRNYRVALMRMLLLGMDHIAPLEAFAAAHPERVPPVGSGRDVKLVIVDALGAHLARELGGLDRIDTDRDGRLSVAEIAAAIARMDRSGHDAIA